MLYKPVPFGLDLKTRDKSITYKRDILKLEKERLKIRYLISQKYFQDYNKDDLIFFFHGSGRSELQWLDNNGFGIQFYNILDKFNTFKDIPVISISFGASILLVDNVPFPFNANLQEIFLTKIVPYFQDKLNRNGKIFLIGHSVGGFTALTLSLKYRNLFPCVIAISPFLTSISPFDQDFINKVDGLKNEVVWAKMLQGMLLYLFKNEENWNNFNPFNLIENKNIKLPYIFITNAEKELAGFKMGVNDFIYKLKERDKDFYYLKTRGDHHNSFVEPVYYSFFTEIYNKKIKWRNKK